MDITDLDFYIIFTEVINSLSEAHSLTRVTNRFHFHLALDSILLQVLETRCLFVSWECIST